MKTKVDVKSMIEEKVANLRAELEASLKSTGKIEDAPGGWETLLNKNVLILCAGYFYIGQLTGVNATFVQLTNGYVIYNVEDFNPKNWKPASKDKLPNAQWNVQLCSVESFGEF